MSDSLFTTIYSSLDAWQTHLMRAALEAEGIEAFVDNENHAGVNWLYTNALGGVTLRVYTRDAERAARIIGELEGELPEAVAEDGEPSQAESPDGPPACPVCGSRDIGLPVWPKFLVILSWCLLGLPFLFRRHRVCRDCGARWRMP